MKPVRSLRAGRGPEAAAAAVRGEAAEVVVVAANAGRSRSCGRDDRDVREVAYRNADAWAAAFFVKEQHGGSGTTKFQKASEGTTTQGKAAGKARQAIGTQTAR